MRITIDVPDSHSLDNKHFVGSVLAAALDHIDKVCRPEGTRIYEYQGAFARGHCVMHIAVNRTIDRD